MNYNYFNPKKTVLLLMSVILILLSECIMAQEENRYVPETDPLVNQKLEQWQDIKFVTDAPGNLQPVGHCGVAG